MGILEIDSKLYAIETLIEEMPVLPTGLRFKVYQCIDIMMIIGCDTSVSISRGSLCMLPARVPHEDAYEQ